MTDDTVALERELVADLSGLDAVLADDKLSTELYRALAGRLWRKDGGPDGHVSLSWGRAEEIVNELRGRSGHSALTLAQTGGEGEVARTLGTELDRLGWHSAPLNPERHDPGHSGRPASAPPGDRGEAGAPVEESRGWEREAHREAEERRGHAAPVEGRGEGG